MTDVNLTSKLEEFVRDLTDFTLKSIDQARAEHRQARNEDLVTSFRGRWCWGEYPMVIEFNQGTLSEQLRDLADLLDDQNACVLGLNVAWEDSVGEFCLTATVTGTENDR